MLQDRDTPSDSPRIIFCQNRLWVLLVTVLSLSCLLWAHPVFADWSSLIERLMTDGLEEEKVRTLFASREVKFEPDTMAGKIEELVKKQSAQPGAASSWKHKAVYRGFLNPRVIAEARVFLDENKAILKKIQTDYCVPREIVVAILLVETYLGKNLGGKFAFNRLASMALCTDLETIRPYLAQGLLRPENEEFARTRCREKADWAYAELKALMRYASASGVDPLSIRGSHYGAIGLCQFMPTNLFSYGVDADQDGLVDPFTKPDAIHSIANYLRGHGWQCQMDRASQHKVIFAYNRSTMYVNTVLGVAEKLKNKPNVRKKAA